MRSIDNFHELGWNFKGDFLIHGLEVWWVRGSKGGREWMHPISTRWVPICCLLILFAYIINRLAAIWKGVLHLGVVVLVVRSELGIISGSNRTWISRDGQKVKVQFPTHAPYEPYEPTSEHQTSWFCVQNCCRYGQFNFRDLHAMIPFSRSRWSLLTPFWHFVLVICIKNRLSGTSG